MPLKDRYVLPSSERRKLRKRVAPKPKSDPALKKLNRRQELFVQELVSQDGFITQTEAAINAGFPTKSARTRASEMMNPNKNPHVVRAIQQYREELNQKYAVTFNRHLKDLSKLKEESLSNGAYSAAVQAEKLRGQAAGLYVSKSEVRYGSIDSMSKEQVLKELETIKENYGAIDVAPEEEGEPVLEPIEAEIVEEPPEVVPDET